MEINGNLQGSIKIPLPKPFTGKYEEWEEWSWTFKTYLHMMEPTLAPLLEKIEDMPLEVTDDDLKEADNETLTKPV